MRRGALARSGGAIVLAIVSAACQSGEPDNAAAQPVASPAKQDINTIAAALQTKTAALVDAINAKNTDAIAQAKRDLGREADNAENALQSQTGQQANLVNSAVSNIRAAMTNNDVNRLTRARTQLQQAQQ